MTEAALLDIAQRALWVSLQIAAPILGLALVAGVLVSVFQAVTQIQEMTLSFVPKILAVFAAVAIFGPWMAQVLIQFTASLLLGLPGLVR